MIEIEKPKIECVEDPANGTYGKFTVEPLERGYGITLGNALRRIMLSSLPGTAATSIKIAGDQLNEAVVKYMRRKHNLLVGDRTAEDVKIRIGGVYERVSPLLMQVKGRDLITGMPKTVEVSSTEMLEAFKENIIQILEVVHQVLEDTPPELAADIATRGILLTGGGSMLFGMDDLIGETTGIQTTAVDDPISAVAIGTGRYTEFIEGKQTRA